MAQQSNVALYASIAANLAIAATKFTASAITGSSAMLAEGMHSVVDSFDGTLLLLGRHRSRRPPDAAHPLGYARELYFWTLIVAVLFFAVGGGMSVYEGVQRILTPEPLQDPEWNYIVLGFATLFDGTSFVIALHGFAEARGDEGFWTAMLTSKDPSVYTVVLEDGADMIGILLAFSGVYLTHRYGRSEFDGIASVGIGVVLMAVAIFLLVQSHGLLIGEGAEPEVTEKIRAILSEDAAVLAIRRITATHLGPHAVFVAAAVEFHPTLSTADVAHAIDVMEERIRSAAPDVRHIYLEPEVVGGPHASGVTSA